MDNRRGFLKQMAGGAAGFLAACCTGSSKPAFAWAAARRRLPKGTEPKTLVNENPQDLDPRDLEIQPLEQFGTMGLSDRAVTLKDWRLVCEGHLSREIRLTYDQVRALPPLEKPVLLICPGFFANHGTWKGFSLGALLKRAQAEDGVTHVTVRGPDGKYENSQRYPLEDILSSKVFLAYEVNRKPLPQRHGFPLRAVAEGYYGYDWVKYVYKVTVEKI